MKKKLITILLALILLVAAGIVAIVANKIKKNRTDGTTFRKETAVYLLQMLTDADAEKEQIGALYNPLKNDYGITVEELESALETLNMEWTSTDIFDLDKQKESYRLTEEQFLSVYNQLISDYPDTGVTLRTYYVFSQAETVHTNEGDFPYSFLEETELSEEVSDFYVQDETLIYYIGTSQAGTTLHNVWLTGYEEGKAQIFMEDESYSFDCNVTDEDQKKIDTLADVVVTNQGLTDIYLKSEVITGKVLGVTDTGLRIENYGELPRSEYYKIYKVYGQLMEEYTSNILVGFEKASFVVADGVVEACLITEEIKTTNIRVVINNSDYSSVLQSIVKLTCNTSFTMTYGEESRSYPANEQVTLNMDSPWFNYNNPDKVIRFTPEEEDGRIQLMSVERAYGYPNYRGTIEIALIGESLAIVNELPIEEYLYSVIPSEMPTSYPLEALKAQAICARGYAYKAVLAGTYAAYGAHLDDSTNSQVYNNSQENDTSIFAVKDTYGQVALCDGLPMNTYFFSTSYGAFSNDGDVWGGEASTYLTDHMDTEDNAEADLSTEADFIMFIKKGNDMDILEQDEPYYRWNITFTQEELSDTINRNLAERIEKAPSQILVKNGAGKYVKSDIETIGTVQSVTVTERGKSGIIKTMVITGTEAEIQVTGQTNIRNLISPQGIAIVKQDGSTVSNFTSLPSPYYYVEKNGSDFILHGGGFGHGVGMSQNGAKVLANMGYSAEQIVKHYYSGAELENIYEEAATDDGENSDRQ